MKKMIILLSLLAFCILPTTSFACDKVASLNVKSMLSEMGSWYEIDGMVEFSWGSDWDMMNSQQRLQMITTFADSDACLTGTARKIKFYRQGKLVGEASPTSGIKLLAK